MHIVVNMHMLSGVFLMKLLQYVSYYWSSFLYFSGDNCKKQKDEQKDFDRLTDRFFIYAGKK